MPSLTADIIYTVGWLAVGVAVAWSLRRRRRASGQVKEFNPPRSTWYAREHDASVAGGSLGDAQGKDVCVGEDSPEPCRGAIGRLNESLHSADDPRSKEETEQKPLAP